MTRYILDTHAFLWFINDDPALNPHAKTLIENPANTLYLSMSSVWEMAIKTSLHKLTMPTPFDEFVAAQLTANSIMTLGVTLAHVGLVATLPFHHRDPFDRLIIAQSLHEDFPVIGKDEIFDAYGIQRHW